MAISPSSQGVQVDSTLYVSGQLGLDPKVGLIYATEMCSVTLACWIQTGKFVSDVDVVAQAEQSLKNIGAILQAAGTTEQNGRVNPGRI